MHPDLEKLIKMAGEGAGLTEKKRSIILKKAEELGEDMAEVEMMLENLAETKTPAPSVKENESSSQNRRRRCPNCGEVISDYTLTCPECGYALDAESKVSAQVQTYIDKFNQQMMDLEKNTLLGKEQKRITLVNSFSVPITKEALVLGFTYAKAQYQSAVSSGNATAQAWYAKCQQFMDLLKSQSNIDADTQRFIADNDSFLTKKPKTQLTSRQKLIRTIFFVWLGAAVLILFISLVANA